MDLNITFGANENYVSSSLPMLKAYEIHDVTFDGVTYGKVQGRKDPNAEYETIKFEFKNSDGHFPITFFAPKPGDEKRGTRTNSNGHESETPSALERFQKGIGHIMASIQPDALKQLVGKNVSFETLGKFLEKATASKKGAVQTKLKLIADSKGRPAIPYFLNVFRPGEEAVITNNFVGDNLYFTEYELRKAEEFKNQAPTNMASTSASAPVDNISTGGSEDGFDFDML